MRGYYGLGLVVLWTSAWLLWSPASAAQARPSSSSYPGTSQKAGLKGDALIQYDTETNSLIVVTDQETNKEIQKVVESLDRPVPQVLIKVLFLEVTHTNDLNLGIEAMSKKTHRHNFSTQTDSKVLETIFGLADQTTGAFYHVIDEDLDVTIRALAEVTKLEVLSRPSIMTRNNQQAVITVGKRVPFIQNSRITENGETINTVTYDDIGIILQVTPHITEDRVVSMDVLPEISTLTGETVPISNTVNAPVFAMRSAQTGVVVPDGKTVVIGGLMEDSKTKGSKKVPILGDIPGLGALFRSNDNSKSKTELLIFLTPHVVEDANEIETTTKTEKENSQLTPEAFSKEDMKHFLEPNPNELEITPAPAPDAKDTNKPAPKKGNKGVFSHSLH